jgi:hypothetical protein
MIAIIIVSAGPMSRVAKRLLRAIFDLSHVPFWDRVDDSRFQRSGQRSVDE